MDQRGANLGCQVTPLSPLETSWAYQCNVNKRGSPPDDPDDEPTFTSPATLPTCQFTTEIKLNPISLNSPHTLSGSLQVESLHLRITHEIDSLRGTGKLHRDKLVIRQHVATQLLCLVYFPFYTFIFCVYLSTHVHVCSCHVSVLRQCA